MNRGQKNCSASSAKNSCFPKNRRGTDKIMSVYWFVILFIVTGAVVYMVGVFYGNPYDVREVEANVLINHIADCVAEGGYLNKEVIDDEGKFLLNNDNFMDVCNLNFNVEDFKRWQEQEQYYVEVKVFGIAKGNINLKLDCDKEGKNFPVCVERSFYVLDEKGKSYEIKILSVVRKTEKNVQ